MIKILMMDRRMKANVNKVNVCLDCIEFKYV
jgi:hypothetical protein